MVIGITGGIGSGKSRITRELAKRGFAVYDCDREAKRIIAGNPAVQQQIIALLGEEAFINVQCDNVQRTKEVQSTTYNTPYVAKRVFEDRHLLAQLNAIVHPAVKEDIRQRAALLAQRPATDTSHPEPLSLPSSLLFVESAILFEAGLDTLCDKVIVIDAPEDIRIARTIARDYHGVASPDNINKVRIRMHAQNTAAYTHPSDIRPSDIHPSDTHSSDIRPSSVSAILVVNNDGSLPLPRIADNILSWLQEA